MRAKEGQLEKYPSQEKEIRSLNRTRINNYDKILSIVYFVIIYFLNEDDKYNN